MANTPRHGNRVQDSMSKAKDVASHAAEKAKETAGSVTGQAQNLAQRAGDMASDLGQRAGEKVSAVGGQMRTLASTIRENVPQEGVMGSAATAIADGEGKVLDGHGRPEPLAEPGHFDGGRCRYRAAWWRAGPGAGRPRARLLCREHGPKIAARHRRTRRPGGHSRPCFGRPGHRLW